MKKHIRIGSRESKLAVRQAELVIEAILRIYPDIEIELVTMKTTGDKILDKRLDQIGGKGLFVKELDRALVAGEIDLSVHSLKDLPSDIPEEIPLIGFLKREDPRDCLIYKEEFHRDSNKEESFGRIERPRIGSSSKRRMLQLKKLYPNAEFDMIRGNVQTRLGKLEEEAFSATALAIAGLKRLGMEKRADRIFSTEEMIPAAGQGIIAIQGRADRDYQFLNCIWDHNTAVAAAAERAFTKALDGGCSSPMAAYAEIGEKKSGKKELMLTGLYWEEETDSYYTGKKICQLKAGLQKQLEAAEQSGILLAAELKKNGNLSRKL